MRDREHTLGLRSPQSDSRTGPSAPFALGRLQRGKNTSSERNEVGLSALRCVRFAQPDPGPVGGNPRAAEHHGRLATSVLTYLFQCVDRLVVGLFQALETVDDEGGVKKRFKSLPPGE